MLVSGHPDTLHSMNNLALVYSLQGKYAEAETLHGQNPEIRRRVLGPEHLDTLASMFEQLRERVGEIRYLAEMELARVQNPGQFQSASKALVCYERLAQIAAQPEVA